MQLSLSQTQRNLPDANNSTLRDIFPVHDSMLFDFFCNRLGDLYSAVKLSRKFLAKTPKLVTTPILKETFQYQFITIDEHLLLIKDVMISIEVKTSSKKNNTIDALINEAIDVCDITVAGTASRDIGLILAVQKMKDCLISSYTGIIQLARTLGYENLADLLSHNLEDEHRFVKALSVMAENDINYLISSDTYKEKVSKKPTIHLKTKALSTKNKIYYGSKNGITKIYRPGY